MEAPVHRFRGPDSARGLSRRARKAEDLPVEHADGVAGRLPRHRHNRRTDRDRQPGRRGAARDHDAGRRHRGGPAARASGLAGQRGSSVGRPEYWLSHDHRGGPRSGPRGRGRECVRRRARPSPSRSGELGHTATDRGSRETAGRHASLEPRPACDAVPADRRVASARGLHGLRCRRSAGGDAVRDADWASDPARGRARAGDRPAARDRRCAGRRERRSAAPYARGRGKPHRLATAGGNSVERVLARPPRGPDRRGGISDVARRADVLQRRAATRQRRGDKPDGWGRQDDGRRRAGAGDRSSREARDPRRRRPATPSGLRQAWPYAQKRGSARSWPGSERWAK